MECSSETGLQLLARLSQRPSLLGLDPVLFPNGPNPKEIIEVSGDASCGKTLLFTQFIVRAILPRDFQLTYIGGLCAGVVLINTDLHFQMYKLVSMMELFLRNCTNNQGCAQTVALDVSHIEDIIKLSLNRLTIYNISDSAQLFITLHALQNLVSQEPNISLVLIDSVCANYWQDTMVGGIRKMDLYTQTLLKTLQRLLPDFKGVIMYSRPSYFQSKSRTFDACSAEPGFGNVTCRIRLQTTETKGNVFCAEVQTAILKMSQLFTICSGGFVWIN